MFRPRSRPPRQPSLVAWSALGRYVLVPTADGPGPGRLVDVELLQTLGTDTSDLDLGRATVSGLAPPRTLSGDSAGHSRLAARQLQRAFGVTTDRAWLATATQVDVQRRGDMVRLSPWRHVGQRNRWVGVAGDPVIDVAADDAAALGRSLRELLALSLPPG